MTPQMPAQTESWVKKLGTDALVLATITAIGYALAYRFEMGFANHFGYPRYLIEPTTGTIAYSLMFMVLGAFIFLPLATLTFQKGQETGRYIDRQVVDMALFLALLLLAMMSWTSFGTTWRTAINVCAIFTGYFLFVWLENRVRARGVPRTRLQRLKAMFAGIFLLMCVAVGASLLGASTAKYEKRYSFLKDDPAFAVVRIYNGTMIAVKYDFERNTFLDEFRLIRLGDSKEGIGFTTKRLAKADRPLQRDND